MKKTLQNLASGFARQMGKSYYSHFRYLAGTALILGLCSCCSDDNEPYEYSDVNTLECKIKPSQISFGDDTSTIVYNEQDKPIKITTKEYNIAAPAAPPVITVYAIDYNTQGNAIKVSKSVDNQLELYYNLEYNSEGKLIKQSEFNSGGTLVASTIANYGDSNVLTSITTHKEGTWADVTSSYEYMDGNLVKKTVQNLYDVDSQEYYNADYTYTYFLDKENRINAHFDGPLGLVFLSNLSNQQSLQYLPNRVNYQLFFAQETAYENKMLKNIEIIAHRYATSDTTNIDYSYEYDIDGYPTLQRGNYSNVTRRYVPAPGGGSVLLVSPHNNTNESTMNFYCN